MRSSDGSTKGLPWTQDEIALVVADYFQMRALFLRGEPFVKAHHHRRITQQTGRSTASVERKYMNISAVLERLGLQWLSGYAPLQNFQAALLTSVEGFIAQEWDEAPAARAEPSDLPDHDHIRVEEPPAPQAQDKIENSEMERLVRRFDPARRDERNRALGLEGERCVLEHERTRLTNHGRSDLARKVIWISQEKGDGAGFDIQSFNLNGEERFLEVKTTRGPQRTPFYLSANEREFSNEAPERFRIFRLYGWGTDPRAFLIKPPLESRLILSPTAYRASFG